MKDRPSDRRSIRSIGIAGISLIAAAVIATQPSSTARATFAGGCFWSMEEPFEKLPGVVSVTAGYTGGSKEAPTDEDVSSGRTGHAESVEILYDPSRITYERLLDVFWHNIDPFTPNGQFCDHGRQYRTKIFFQDDEQRRLAEESKRHVEEELHATVVTEVTAASTFYPAEKGHQDFYKKNPVQYHRYRSACGRDSRLRQIWGAAAGRGEVKP